jgi:hypothetical protein
MSTSDIIESTPRSLEGVILNKLKLGRKYHSGSISNGVANAFEAYIISNGWPRDIPNINPTTPRMSTGKMYSISFGHAGSPYVLLDIPDDRREQRALL